MTDLKGTQTEKKIAAAFEGESKAHNRYIFFEEQARREGNEELAVLFTRMAKNELLHSQLWFKLLRQGTGQTAENVRNAIAMEHEEWCRLYPSFAKTAREEGFEEIARCFEQIAAIERDHERSLHAASASENPQPNKRDAHQIYRCIFCGAIFPQRPEICGICGAVGSFEPGFSPEDPE